MPLGAEVHTMHQVGIAMWPAGAQYIFEAELRWKLSRSESLLMRDSAVSLIGHAELTPAFPRGGLTLRVAPIAVWDLTLRAWGTWYFGNFSAVIPVDDPSFAATAEAKAARADTRVPGWGLRLDVDSRVKLKAGPFIAVLEGEVRHHDVHTPDGQPMYWWEPTEMLLIPGEGWVFNRHLYLLEEFEPRDGDDDAFFYAGVYGVWSTSLGTGDENIRMGPLVIVKPAPGPTWPSFFVGMLPWIESRFIADLPPYTFLAANWSR